MATAKKSLVDKAMASKVVTSAKDMIDGAIGAVSDAFAGTPDRTAPLAVQTTGARMPMTKMPAAKKRAAKKVGAKKATPAKKTSKKQDGKLVSTMEVYEVKYLAQKHKVTQKAVKEAVTKVGHSRNKVEAELKAQKAKSG